MLGETLEIFGEQLRNGTRVDTTPSLVQMYWSPTLVLCSPSSNCDQARSVQLNVSVYYTPLV